MSQVIDMEACQEFMRETLGRIQKDDLVTIAGQLENKSEFFKENLNQVELPTLTIDEVTAVFKKVFITSRKIKMMFEKYSLEDYKASIYALLYSDLELQDRFQNFVDAHPELSIHIRYDLAGELLHYSQPEKWKLS